MFLDTQIRGLHEYERVSQVVFKLKLGFEESGHLIF